MTVIFSKKCELGLQAVLYLSIQEKDKRFTAGEVAGELNIPQEFVSKVLQELRSSGIVGSKKGKNGGFYLAKEPSEIKLIDIVYALDGEEVLHECVLGFPGCSVKEPCPLHNKWGKVTSDVLQMLGEETLEELKEKTKHKIANL